MVHCALSRTGTTCRYCGEFLEGDGYSTVLYCPNSIVDTKDKEPDSGPIYCGPPAKSDTDTARYFGTFNDYKIEEKS